MAWKKDLMLLKGKLTDVREITRLNAGRAYYSLLENGEEMNALTTKYLKTIDESLAAYSHLVVSKPLNFLENNSFKLWFPIQKAAAIDLSYIKTTTRECHITADLINEYREKLMPGDIFLERREWHATNVGIPGYWTHNALYLGTLQEMEAYFENIPELAGKKFSEFVQENYKAVYEELQRADDKGYKYAVIESKRPGVILMSLEESAGADSLAVLRVKGVSPSDQFRIVTQALSHYGKPYDFDFNFITDNALVCSELVYKAYLDINKLHIELEELNGRLMLSPNKFAKKFAQEYGTDKAELELVLFLDGNEKTGKAIQKGVGEFKESWKRPQ